MSKAKKTYKEVPRYQLIEIPSMFLIMAAIGDVIYGITVAVQNFKNNAVLGGILLILAAVFDILVFVSSVWMVTNSNNPKRALPMTIITAVELAFFIFTFCRSEYALFLPILFVTLLSLQLAGNLILLIKGTKIMNSLPVQPAPAHHGKKKKHKK